MLEKEILSCDKDKAMERYAPGKIEEKWQSVWEKASAFSTDKAIDKEKYYVLEMFPYPSGKSTWDTCAIIPSGTSSRGF